MATKPLVDTAWASQITTDGTSGNLNKQEPSTAFKNFGQPESQPIDRQSINYELDALDQWKAYFENLTDEFQLTPTTTRKGLVLKATLSDVEDLTTDVYPDAATINTYVNETVEAFNQEVLDDLSRIDYIIVSGGGNLEINKKYLISDNATYTLPSRVGGVQGEYVVVSKFSTSKTPSIVVEGTNSEMIDLIAPVDGEVVQTDTSVLYNIHEELTFIFKSPNWEIN